MEWDFIRTVMQKMGFSATWINWIKCCITYVKYHVMMNGHNRGNMVPEGGITRQ